MRNLLDILREPLSESEQTNQSDIDARILEVYEHLKSLRKAAGQAWDQKSESQQLTPRSNYYENYERREFISAEFRKQLPKELKGLTEDDFFMIALLASRAISNDFAGDYVQNAIQNDPQNHYALETGLAIQQDFQTLLDHAIQIQAEPKAYTNFVTARNYVKKLCDDNERYLFTLTRDIEKLEAVRKSAKGHKTPALTDEIGTLELRKEAVQTAQNILTSTSNQPFPEKALEEYQEKLRKYETDKQYENLRRHRDPAWQRWVYHGARVLLLLPLALPFEIGRSCYNKYKYGRFFKQFLPNSNQRLLEQQVRTEKFLRAQSVRIPGKN